MERNKLNKKLKRTSGITLIALVITIIVLLILAAISIVTLTGENGLLTKANEASSKTTESGAMEKIKVSVGESYDERGKFDSEEFKRRIEEKGGSIITESRTDIVVEMDGYQATVDKQTGEIKDIVTAEEGLKPIEKVTDENPGELAGSGTEEEPYLIQSIEDLVGLSNSVSPIGKEPEEGKEYNNYEGKYFKLETTLDFASRDSYVNPDRTDFGDANGDGISGTLIEEMTTGAGFRPIGKIYYGNYTFCGNIDGNNEEIRNLYINAKDHYYQGLLGVVGVENSNSSMVIKNLKLINVDMNVSSPSGALIGISNIGNLYIEDCLTTGNISGDIYTGGIIGKFDNEFRFYGKLHIKNTTNKINVSTTGGNSGGILGKIECQTLDFVNVKNEGNIITVNSGGSFLGGLIGILDEAYEPIVLEKCYNVGNISGNGSYFGGIFGKYQTSNELEIENCYNMGNVQCNRFLLWWDIWRFYCKTNFNE